MRKVKVVTLIALFMVALNANAQIQRGNMLIGGNLANINLGLNGSKVVSVDITPKIAWFIKDNVALGGYVNLGIQTAKHSSTTTNYGVGALGRYYAGDEGALINHGRFFAEATAGIGGVNVSGGDNTNGFDFSVGPGFAYFITPNIGLETLLKYNGLAGFGSEPYQNNLNLSFGFQIYLPTRKTIREIKRDF